jgi:Spy/CpxP family protein refolding chaperone
MARRFVVFTLAVALLAVGSGWAAAQDSGSRPRHEHRGQKFQQWLGLSQDQMNQIRAIRQRDAETWRQTAKALRAAQTDLRRLALGGADATQLQAKETEVQQLLAQVLQLRVKSLQEIGPLLTPEQREKLAQAGPGGFRHHGPRAPTS